MNSVNTGSSLWPPALVAVAGIAISVAIWSDLVADRRRQILASTVEVAAQTRTVLELYLEQQLSVLEGLRDLWSRFPLQPIDEWEADVNQWADRVPGLDSVSLFDLDESRELLAGGRQPARNEIAVLDERSARDLQRPHLIGPNRAGNGGFDYWIFLPIRMADGHAGAVVARIDIFAFCETVLKGRASGYALSVFWGEDEIFTRGGASTSRRPDWWALEEIVDLPLAGVWRVAHRPTDALVAAQLTAMPHYLLLLGVLLSLALAASFHQFRLLVRQSRELRESNRALEERGSELESQVAVRTQALEQAIEELEAFNYSVSHDLRSPLGAILNFVAILDEDYRGKVVDDEALAMLGRIRRSAARAGDLIDDLMRLSRAGRRALNYSRVDMTELVRETFAQVAAASGRSTDGFHVEPLPEANGDRALLSEVFANLLGNAIKYSVNGKGSIQVRGWVEDDECIYEVADDGRGFDMRYAAKLFGLFERLEPTSPVEGSGVGLAIVARIVKRHAGRVWAESEPNRGARFFFSLPRRDLAQKPT